MDSLFLLLLLGVPLILSILYLLALVVLKKKKKINILPLSIYGWAFVIVLIIVCFVLWPMGTGSPPLPPANGPGLLKPLAPSIVYKANGSFETMFTNACGTSIRITSVAIDETLDDVGCSDVKVNGNDLSSVSVLVSAGDGFTVTAVCETKSEGDPFDLLIVIKYDSVLNGVSSSHTESGHIRGSVE